MKEFYIVSYQGKIYQGENFKRADSHLTKGLKQNQNVTWGTITSGGIDLIIKMEYFTPTGDTENPRVISETVSVPYNFLEFIVKKYQIIPNNKPTK